MINLGSHRDKTWPDGWTSVTEDGQWSAQFEHTLGERGAAGSRRACAAAGLAVAQGASPAVAQFCAGWGAGCLVASQHANYMRGMGRMLQSGCFALCFTIFAPRPSLAVITPEGYDILTARLPDSPPLWWEAEAAAQQGGGGGGAAAAGGAS